MTQSIPCTVFFKSSAKAKHINVLYYVLQTTVQCSRPHNTKISLATAFFGSSDGISKANRFGATLALVAILPQPR
jgi:hypothetical protein